MSYTRTGSVVLAAAGGAYAVGSLAITAAVLVLGGTAAFIMASRRRRQDRMAIRRQA
jgi:hypothetical protein